MKEGESTHVCVIYEITASHIAVTLRLVTAAGDGGDERQKSDKRWVIDGVGMGYHGLLCQSYFYLLLVSLK